MLRKKVLYMYLIASSTQSNKNHTYIGCSSNFKKRLKQHNGEISGGPRITRKSNTIWVPLFIIQIPKNWNYSTKQLKYDWKTQSRGIVSRLYKGISIANQYGFRRYISSDLVLKNGDIKSDIKHCIKAICFSKK